MGDKYRIIRHVGNRAYKTKPTKREKKMQAGSHVQFTGHSSLLGEDNAHPLKGVEGIVAKAGYNCEVAVPMLAYLEAMEQTTGQPRDFWRKDAMESGMAKGAMVFVEAQSTTELQLVN